MDGSRGETPRVSVGGLFYGDPLCRGAELFGMIDGFCELVEETAKSEDKSLQPLMTSHTMSQCGPLRAFTDALTDLGRLSDYLNGVRL